ncbi:hypothetical protein D920_01711 [Enterococcus faecalis 13-SD-W-01]|nr:hypothetical protein D920_01711 [Enterococcus faecalis 13-SD-W-01]
MTRNEAFQEILSLTPDPSWMSDPVKVARVQALSRIANGEIKPRKKTKRKRKVIEVYHNDKLLIEGYSDTLSRAFGITAQRLNDRARSQFVDSRGRLFKYREEK